ncbi:hypothetical protein C7974DRAFT_410221 [Boeremia exigua]|uniref:uncharacterized protein n=1 Tax=Boeremia exigua TaxID=749465 RepID=UPI001E8DD05B|nr:uncharacterized protein C7974DRAFT_410221 [Boeremia exigua]KAH6639238.1 hypothetical protein C7974DRAFT_410221 [Boeremia exigua]
MKLIHLAPLLLLPNSVIGLAILPETVEISNVAINEPTGKDLVVFRDETSMQLEKRQARAFAVRVATGSVRVLGNLSFHVISFAAGILTTELANKIAAPIVAEIHERGRLIWSARIEGRTCSRRVVVECESNDVEIRLVPT